MTNDRFNEIVLEATERIKGVLIKKQAEYNLDEDRLSHFKRAAVLAQETPEKVLYGYAIKHIMSISDMVASEKEYARDAWLEKMTDLSNYLILLLGLLEDDGMLAEQNRHSAGNKAKASERQLLLEGK